MPLFDSHIASFDVGPLTLVDMRNVPRIARNATAEVAAEAFKVFITRLHIVGGSEIKSRDAELCGSHLDRDAALIDRGYRQWVTTHPHKAMEEYLAKVYLPTYKAIRKDFEFDDDAQFSNLAVRHSASGRYLGTITLYNFKSLSTRPAVFEVVFGPFFNDAADTLGADYQIQMIIEVLKYLLTNPIAFEDNSRMHIGAFRCVWEHPAYRWPAENPQIQMVRTALGVIANFVIAPVDGVEIVQFIRRKRMPGVA